MTCEEQARHAAARFREEHGLGTAPLADIVSLIELTQSIDVAILDAGPDSHGMTVRDPARGIVMVAAARTSKPMRQRSTLGHELAHIVFGDYATPRAEWGKRDPEEIRADAFARHLLVPLEGIPQAAHLPSGQDASLATLSALVQHFQASPMIVAIQLAGLGLISPEVKRQWLGPIAPTAPSLASKFGWSDQYRALQRESNTRRAPQRLLARAVDGYVRGVVSIAYVARLRGMDTDSVQAELAEQGIEPLVETDSGADLSPSDDSFPVVDLSGLDELGLDDELPPE